MAAEHRLVEGDVSRSGGDEIRDLHRRPTAGGFRAVIGATGLAGDTAAALGAPGLTVADRHEDRWKVTAADAGALARLLEACHADGLVVIDIQRDGGDLESDFLAGLTREVASC